MKFTYKARNKAGEIQSGEVVAADQDKAEHLLTQNGLVIISLEQQGNDFFAKYNPFGKSINYKDLVLFSRQLSTLISARVPIIQSLRILQEQVNSKYLQEIINELITSLENGDSLSNALAKFDKVFGNVYVSLVRSGELGGTLDKSLVYLADQLEKDYELRSKVKGAMTYPIFVLSALGIIGALMFKFVLPNLTSVLQQQGGTLPQTTLILIAATEFFNKFWWLILMSLVGGFFGIKYYINTVIGRYHWDALKIHLPIVGDIFKKIYLARFSRNLSTLVLGGIPIIKALEIVAQLVNNVIYRDILLDSITQISAGKSISEGLAGHPEFPNIVTQMVHVGEQTAQLDDILSKLAGFYEKEVDTKIGTLTTLLEPLIMIVLGIGVGILVAGVLLPIYNLASAGS